RACPAPPCPPRFPYTTLFRSRPSRSQPYLLRLLDGDFAFPSREGRARRSASRSWSQKMLMPNSLCARCRLISLYTPESTTAGTRSEEHTSELQSGFELVCRLL